MAFTTSCLSDERGNELTSSEVEVRMQQPPAV